GGPPMPSLSPYTTLFRSLARHVDGGPPGEPERGERLQQQRRLADPRVAADQQHRAGHQPAAGYPVELGDAGDRALGLRLAAGERSEEHTSELQSRENLVC